jgi:chaperonin GroEL
MSIADISPSYYGQCNKAIISSKKAAFLGFMGDIDTLVERLEEIETEESMAENDFYKKKHSVRYGKLQGNAAVIGISGMSEQEIQNKLERVDDALNATRAAIAEGVIRGAGVELYSIGLAWTHDDISEIEDVFYKTLKSPLQKIYYNINVKELYTEQDSVISDGFLYDGNNNMFTREAPVFDPVKVVKSSLRSAVSVAGYVLTADCLIGE